MCVCLSSIFRFTPAGPIGIRFCLQCTIMRKCALCDSPPWVQIYFLNFLFSTSWLLLLRASRHICIRCYFVRLQIYLSAKETCTLIVLFGVFGVLATFSTDCYFVVLIWSEHYLSIACYSWVHPTKLLGKFVGIDLCISAICYAIIHNIVTLIMPSRPAFVMHYKFHTVLN